MNMHTVSIQKEKKTPKTSNNIGNPCRRKAKKETKTSRTLMFCVCVYNLFLWCNRSEVVCIGWLLLTESVWNGNVCIKPSRKKKR